MTATVKVDSGGYHANSGRGSGRSQRGQPARQHPCPPGTLSPTATAKALATSVTDETAAMPAAVVTMSAQLPSGGSDGGGGGGDWGGWGCGGLA